MEYLKQVDLVNTDQKLGQYFTRESMDSIHKEGERSIRVELSALQEIYDEINQFRRYRELNNRAIAQLKHELAQTQAQLKQALALTKKFNDAQLVQETRNAVLNHVEREPGKEPIDRNGVAPCDVRVEEIFNFSGKRV